MRTRLEYEYRDQLEQTLDIDPLMRLSRMEAMRDGETDDTPAPPIPELLKIFRLMSSTGLPYRSGGLEDQPYLMLQGFLICEDEERRIQNQIALNQSIQAAQHASQQQPR